MTFILLIYLFILIFIAIKSSKNIHSISDFFVARKNANLLSITGSIVATILGGSAIIGAIDAGAKLGGASAWFMITASLGLLILIPFTSKAYKLGKYSLPDMLENLFGKTPRMVANFIIPIAWTGIIATQIIASAKLLQYFIPINYSFSVIISASVFIFYTIAGGQYSILRTDFFQAVLIISGLIILAVFTNNYFPFEFKTFSKINNEFTFPFNNNFSIVDLILLFLTYGTTYTVGPDMYSRIFCAKNANTAKKSIFIAAIILLPISIIIGYLATISNYIYPSEGATIMWIAKSVVPNSVLPIIAIALLSVVLSSADTILLNSSIIIYESFNLNKENSKNSKKMLSVKKARLIIFINGIIACVIALYFTNIIETLLLSLAIYAGAFTIPILWGLMGLYSNEKFITIAIITGGVLALSGKLFVILKLSNYLYFGDILLILSFVINALILFLGRNFKVHTLKKL